MEVSFSPCSLDEWAVQANKIETSNIIRPVNSIQNTFLAVQFIDEERKLLRPEAYCLKLNSQPIAWCMTYYLSTEVIRIRGLYTDSRHRNKGHMSALLNHVIDHYRGRAKKCLCFSLRATVGFFEKHHFRNVPEFLPRPIEVYDPLSGKYNCDPNDVVTLLEKHI